MTNSTRAHHIALKVHNLKSAEEFYGKLLGLSVISRSSFADKSPRSVWLNLGGSILMLEKAGEDWQATPKNACGWHLLALAIEKASREEWKKRLNRAGVQITSESEHSIYFSDPEGNRLALSHY